MMEIIADFWGLFAIASLWLLVFILNSTVFSDADVRPVKDHLEEGWGKTLDEDSNKEQAYKRGVTVKVTLLASFVVLIAYFITQS